MNLPHFERAVTLFEAGEFELALEQFQQLAITTSDSSHKASLLVDQATCLTEMGRIADAKRCLAEAKRLTRDDPREAILIELSHICLLLREDDQPAALAQLGRLLEEYGDCLRTDDFHFLYQDIQMQRGFLLMQLDRYQEALPILEEVRSFQSGGEICCHLGRCYHGLGRHLSAQQHLLLAAEAGVPEDWQAAFHYYLGCSYHELGQFALAKQQFLFCIQAEAADAPAKVYQKLAAACSQLGGHEDAAHYTQLACATVSTQRLAHAASSPY